MRNPRRPAEWQEAVDLAGRLAGIADAKIYGLLEGGPEIDVVPVR